MCHSQSLETSSSAGSQNALVATCTGGITVQCHVIGTSCTLHAMSLRHRTLTCYGDHYYHDYHYYIMVITVIVVIIIIMIIISKAVHTGARLPLMIKQLGGTKYATTIRIMRSATWPRLDAYWSTTVRLPPWGGGGLGQIRLYMDLTSPTSLSPLPSYYATIPPFPLKEKQEKQQTTRGEKTHPTRLVLSLLPSFTCTILYYPFLVEGGGQEGGWE